MLDLDNELKVAEEFWDFLGGKGAYLELLNCFVGRDFDKLFNSVKEYVDISNMDWREYFEKYVGIKLE